MHDLSITPLHLWWPNSFVHDLSTTPLPIMRSSLILARSEHNSIYFFFPCQLFLFQYTYIVLLNFTSPRIDIMTCILWAPSWSVLLLERMPCKCQWLQGSLLQRIQDWRRIFGCLSQPKGCSRPCWSSPCWLQGHKKLDKTIFTIKDIIIIVQFIIILVLLYKLI